MTRRVMLLTAAILMACDYPSGDDATLAKAEAWAAACAPWDDWEKPGPPFQIHGNTYYVGTCGIAVVLITGEEGHILIDGASRGGGPLVKANVEALGFDIEDVSVLLHTHEHFDHVGGLAYLQRASGATVIASPQAAPVLRSGELAANDPQAGMHDPFEAMPVGQIIEGGETVRVGPNTLTAIATPGHTPGALSWTWRSCEEDGCRSIAFIDSLSPISADSYKFTSDLGYLKAFRRGLENVATAPCDVIITPHPSASEMIRRLREGEGLTSANGCDSYAAKISTRLERRIEEERTADAN